MPIRVRFPSEALIFNFFEIWKDCTYQVLLYSTEYRTALEYEKKNLVKGSHYCFMILADKNGADEKCHKCIER